MSLAFLYWIIYLLWVVLGFWTNWPTDSTKGYVRPLGGNVVLLVLLFLLGWKCMGWPIHD